MDEMQETIEFHTTILTSGKTATGIRIPPEVISALGAGKRPPVRVTINGFTYRSTVAVMGGEFMVGVNAQNRAGAGVAGGDEVMVELELDTDPREIAVPPALAAALDTDPELRRRFDLLSYSGKQRHVLPIEQAKTAETRERRIAKTVDALRTQASGSG